jgi:hypothetical protein
MQLVLLFLSVLMFHSRFINKGVRRFSFSLKKKDAGFGLLEYKITSSALQSKEWRKQSNWYIDGKHNECEIYQRKLVEKITNTACVKTNARLNIFTNELSEVAFPMKQTTGFEWSENFDGVIQNKNQTYYVNLKMICEKGGAQTRSLREVYHFIHSQLGYLRMQKMANHNTYFVNILDGDMSYKYIDKFYYLLENSLNKKKQKFVFVGDMAEFNNWWKNLHRASYD